MAPPGPIMSISNLDKSRCPRCGEVVTLWATAPSFLAEPQWAFWGQHGARWIKCQQIDVVHFTVTVPHGTQHRLAWLDPSAWESDEPVQGAWV